MRIGFDGRYAEGDLVGVGKYIKSLVLELDKLGVTCIIFYSKKPKYKITGENIKSVILPNSNRITFEQILLPRAFKDHKIDIYHACGNIGIPLLSNTKSVLTVHDLIPLQIKNYFSYSKIPSLSKYLYLFRLKSSIEKADRIVTVSEYTKEELVKRKVNPEKILAIHSGLNLLPEQLPINKAYGDYILNNGGMDVRKNTDNLIKSFSDVHKVFPKINLVITGNNSGYKKKLEKLVAQLGLQGFVIFTGYVNEGEMASLIKNAKCVCYPSLIEGFGFPVLEAFSLGTPVITSNTSSLPEIAGDAALLINPGSRKEISDAIKKVLRDDKLSLRLRELGFKQVKKYNWKKAANEYLDLYNSI